MRIDKNSQVAGIPILEIRHMLRRSANSYLTREEVADVLGLSNSDAKRVVQTLQTEGFIEPDPTWEGHYRNTTRGNALCMASTGTPIYRKTAERLLAEFMERVRKVNADPYYLYAVTEVRVFGSFIADAERLGDIDVAIKLESKERDPEIQTQLSRARAGEAIRQGRRFGTFLEELFWAENEVRLFLRARSRVLNLHSADDPVLKQTDSKLIYP